MQKILDTIVYWAKFSYLFIINGFKVKTALFYPDKPSHRAIVSKILEKLNYNITTNPNHKFDIAINWIDATFREQDSTIKSLLKNHSILNSNCFDISKQFVGEVFEEIFGYPLLVNPFEYKGKCVCKNDLNARKDDTKIVECPIKEKKEGFVYVKLIDTRIDENYVFDYRVPIIGNRIPLIYLKTKSVATFFQNDTVDVQFTKPEEYLSKEEMQNIIKFCRRIGLDTGELDVLRDNEDKRIYIIDANNTSWGPPNQMPKHEKQKALNILTEAFQKEYLNN